MITARRRSGSSLYEVTCTATENIGDLVVVMNADKVVQKTDVTNYARMPAAGILVAKFSDVRALMQVSGPLEGLFSDLHPGRLYFVGADGRPTATPPTATPGQRCFIQPVGTALDINVLLFEPSRNLIALRG
jgi:hypothetical protein